MRAMLLMLRAGNETHCVIYTACSSTSRQVTITNTVHESTTSEGFFTLSVFLPTPTLSVGVGRIFESVGLSVYVFVCLFVSVDM